MNNQKNTLTATVGFVLTKGTKIHEAKTLDEVKEDAADILDAMQQTEIEASRITVLISALKIVRDFVNENLVRVDVED